jgi:hypothetical protein
MTSIRLQCQYTHTPLPPSLPSIMVLISTGAQLLLSPPTVCVCVCAYQQAAGHCLFTSAIVHAKYLVQCVCVLQFACKENTVSCTHAVSTYMYTCTCTCRLCRLVYMMYIGHIV